jgi:hypothetical protein
MDKLVECKRCGGNACYEQNIDENLTTWLCMGCGFTTSTLMTPKSSIVAQAVETSPELYKELMFEDVDKRTWLPSTLTLPGKGMVFLDGTSKTDWKWAGVKAVEITDEDRKGKNFPKDQTHRMDMVNVKHYGQKEFMDAMEEIGFFNIEE